MALPAKGRTYPFSARKDKLEVNYRNAEKCQMCDFFLNGRCESVEGNISPDATCDLWQIRSARPRSIGAEFYVSEFNKKK